MKKVLVGVLICVLSCGIANAEIAKVIPTKDTLPQMHLSIGSSSVYNKISTATTVAATSVWSPAAVNKQAYVTDIVLYSIDAATVTLYDCNVTSGAVVNALTPTIVVGAGSNTQIHLVTPIVGNKYTVTATSATTSVTVSASIKAICSTPNVTIQLLGWEK